MCPFRGQLPARRVTELVEHVGGRSKPTHYRRADGRCPTLLRLEPGFEPAGGSRSIEVSADVQGRTGVICVGRDCRSLGLEAIEQPGHAGAIPRVPGVEWPRQFEKADPSQRRGELAGCESLAIAGFGDGEQSGLLSSANGNHDHAPHLAAGLPLEDRTRRGRSDEFGHDGSMRSALRVDLGPNIDVRVFGCSAEPRQSLQVVFDFGLEVAPLPGPGELRKGRRQQRLGVASLVPGDEVDGHVVSRAEAGPEGVAPPRRYRGHTFEVEVLGVEDDRGACSVDAPAPGPSGELGEISRSKSLVRLAGELREALEYHGSGGHVDAEGQCLGGEDQPDQALGEQRLDGLLHGGHHPRVVSSDSARQQLDP